MTISPFWLILNQSVNTTRNERTLNVLVYYTYNTPKYFFVKDILKKYLFFTKRGFSEPHVELNIYNHNQLNILTFQPGQFFVKYHLKYYLTPPAPRVTIKIRG